MGRFDEITKTIKDAAFFATQSELKRAEKKVLKKSKKTTIGLQLRTYQIEKLKKLSSKKLSKEVKAILKEFKSATDKSLKYVMVPSKTHQKIVKAFEKKKVVVVSPTVLENNTFDRSGLFVVDSDDKNAVKAVLKTFKKQTVQLVNLAQCIPKESKLFVADEPKKTRRMNAARAAEEVSEAEATEAETTEAEVEKTTESEQNNVKAADSDSGASALTISSFAAIAAVSVAAMLML